MNHTVLNYIFTKYEIRYSFIIIPQYCISIELSVSKCIYKQYLQSGSSNYLGVYSIKPGNA